MTTRDNVDDAVAARPGRTPRPSRLGAWRRDRRLLYGVVPAVLLLIVFAYPIVRMFLLSFTSFLDPSGSGLDNYRWFLGSSVELRILRRTFEFAFVVTLACFVLGFPYAYLMSISGRKARLLLLGLVLAPYWTSLIVRTYAWLILLQDNGPVVNAIKHLGLGTPHIIDTPTAVTIGMTQVMLPFMIFPLYVAMVGIDRRLLLAAQSLGASPRIAFLKVYVPLALPGIVAGATIVFIVSLGFYFTPALLGSNGSSMISQQIVQQVTKLLAFGRGGAIGLVLLVVTLLILAVAARFLRPLTRAVNGKG